MLKKYRGSVSFAQLLMDDLTANVPHCDPFYHWSKDTVRLFRPKVLTVQCVSENGRIVAVGTIERMTRPDCSVTYRAQWCTVVAYTWEGQTHHRVNDNYSMFEDSRSAYAWLKANIP